MAGNPPNTWAPRHHDPGPWGCGVVFCAVATSLGLVFRVGPSATRSPTEGATGEGFQRPKVKARAGGTADVSSTSYGSMLADGPPTSSAFPESGPWLLASLQ